MSVVVSAEDVRKLRAKTGSGILDCKHALVESGGDMVLAIDWLRKKGLAKAGMKAGRAVFDGLVGVSVSGLAGALVEVNSETDFVARNAVFGDLARNLSNLSLSVNGSIERLLEMPYPNTDRTVSEHISDTIAMMGESIRLRRTECISVGSGVIAQYVHNSVSQGVGRIGVLVAVESFGDQEQLAILGHKLAMHVAGHDPAPLVVHVEDTDKESLRRGCDPYVAQKITQVKKSEVIEPRSFYEDVVLLSQKFIFDPGVTVGGEIERVARELGCSVTVKSFIRYLVGEDLDVKS